MTRTRLRPGGDEGFALPVVFALVLALSGLVGLAVSLSGDSVRASGRDSNYHAALDAAQAGVQDYLNRLNIDDTYFEKGNSHPATGSDPGNAALVPAPESSAPGGWTPVAAGGGATFRYGMLNTPEEVRRDGTIRLRSLGRVGDETRTVEAVLGKGSFLDYLYFSTYETTPPIAAADPDVAATTCERFSYSGRPETCPVVSFGDGDTLSGPVHSQDTIVIKGATTFQDIVTTSWPDTAGVFWRASANATPVPQFQKGTPQFKVLELPTRNEALAASAASSGCVYTGPTRILLHANGTMTVTSPYSASLLLAPGCGSFNAPDYTSTVTVPQGRVVLVRGAPASCIPSLMPVIKFPVAGDNGYRGTTKLGYSCTQGDLFVEGRMPGRATFYAQNNVIVTGNLEQAAGISGTGALGLVADSVVAVYHPVACTAWEPNGYCRAREESGTVHGTNVARSADPVSTTAASVPTAYPMQNVTIQAAVLALQNGFLVQNHRAGLKLNNLVLHGAIAQKFRGAVSLAMNGAHESGYLKDYRYDGRLRYAPPPAMANLATTAWEVRQFAEKTG